MPIAIMKEANKDRSRHPSPDIFVSNFYKLGPDYHIIRTEGSKEWLILFTTFGCGAYKAGGDVSNCEKGDVVILPAGVAHDYKTAGTEWGFHWAHFIPCEEWFAKMKLPPLINGIHAVQIRYADRYRQLEQAFQRIHENQLVENIYRKTMALNVMEFIFILMAQEYDNQSDTNAVDPRILNVMHYFSNRLNQTLKLDEIAKQVSLSPSRLSHLFKEETGQTIMDTFLKMRLRHAANLLQYTSHSVEQIADQTGFSSVYYFSNAFKKYTGLSPTAYRCR